MRTRPDPLPGQEALAKRIEAKANVTPDGCWQWRLSTKPLGYGCLMWGGKLYRAHRLSYEAWHGPIPAGLFVMHACDNRGCVNPAHLSVGTARDNTHDMIFKNRMPRGERRHNAKLTPQAVLEIRESNLSNQALSDQYGVSRKLIINVRCRIGWKHIPEAA